MSAEPIKSWTRLLGSSAGDSASSVTTGSDGSIYIAGGTQGNLDGNSNAGSNDAFLSKYNSDGTKSWTRLLGTSAMDSASSVTTGSDGSIYIAGVTQGNLDGNSNAGSEYDAFLSKYNSDGTKSWTRLLGSTTYDYAKSITTGSDGSIYIAGDTHGNLDGNSNAGSGDAFLSKYNSDGTKSWTKLLGSSAFDGAYSVTTGSDGSIYIAGYTQGNLDGNSNAGSNDAFLSKYNSDGTKSWTRLLGTSAGDYADTVTTGSDGSIYIAGITSGNLDGNSNAGNSDAYLSKYNRDGTKSWTRLLGTSAGDWAKSVTTGSDGSIYIAGGTGGNLDGNSNAGGSNDAFLSKYNSDGTKSWTRLLGSSAGDWASSVTTGSDGSIYIAGGTQGNLDGNSNAGSEYDAFLSKFSFPATYTLTPSLTTINEGAVLTSTVNTTNVATGTKFYYALSGTGITTADFSAGALTGEGITDATGKFTFTHTLANDLTTEGAESLYIKLYSDTARTLQVGSTATVSVVDSSTTAPLVVRGNSLYTIVDGPSWAQAEANSVKLGGHLVTINDAQENAFIAKNDAFANLIIPEDWAFSIALNTKSISAWIGRHKDTSDKWQWAGVTTSEYKADLTDSRLFPKTSDKYIIQPILPIDPSEQILGVARKVTTQIIIGKPILGDIGTGYWTEIFDFDDYYDINKDGRYNDLTDGFVLYDNSKQGIAETPFIRRGDSAYVIVQGPTWEEAEANAVKLGGHLVTINDISENNWLFENAIKGISDGVWLGATDKEQEGVWKWADGTPWVFTNWNQNQPSNTSEFDPLGEDYLQFVPGHSGYSNKWNDITHKYITFPHKTSIGIAEIKLAPNNTPTGTPTVTGTFKVGSTLTIDATAIKDSDNFTGYTPTFKYNWETSTDGTTWTKLTTTDGADNNNTYILTAAEVNKKIRGVESYLDGYGTNESVASAGSASITDPSPTYTLTPSATSVNEGSSISYNLTTTNVATGTSLYYQFSGTGITAADFSSATSADSEVVGSNGQLTITRTLTADKTTEGNETLTLKVFTDSAATTPLATNTAVTVNDTSLTPSTPTQKVYTEKSEISYKPTGVAALPLLYTTSSNDANLSGLTLNVHYNSSILTPSGANNGVSGQVPAAITTTTILPDTNNSDGDQLTDKIVQLLWATFDNSFPNKALPTAIATVSFDTSATKKDPVTGQPLSTTVRYTAAEAAPNYDFLTGSTTFKAQQFNLDVDGDGKVTALGDGLMVIRKLFGPAFTGEALTYKAISPEAARTTSEIHDFIQQGIDAGLLDVDKDKKTTALGDGLMVIRRLFGPAFDGGALTSKAISSSSPYFGLPTDFASVAANIDALKPTDNLLPPPSPINVALYGVAVGNGSLSFLTQ